MKATDPIRLTSCPWCGVASPLMKQYSLAVVEFSHGHRRWGTYGCSSCGAAVVAEVEGEWLRVAAPGFTTADRSLPEPARDYLQQAIDSRAQPAGAVMLAAASVDAMLKARGYRDGTLYKRIKQAADDHVLTPDMELWAHDVRLDANDQRHADEGAGLPTIHDAGRAIDFAEALGEYLFVLPARVTKGRENPNAATK